MRSVPEGIAERGSVASESLKPHRAAGRLADDCLRVGLGREHRQGVEAGLRTGQLDARRVVAGWADRTQLPDEADADGEVEVCPGTIGGEHLGRVTPDGQR